MVKFTFEGKDYCLGYNRDTAKSIMNAGYDSAELSSKLLIMAPLLFKGAFLMNHRNTPQKLIDRIYSSLSNKTDLIIALNDDYINTYKTLLDDEPDNENLTEWTVQ